MWWLGLQEGASQQSRYTEDKELKQSIQNSHQSCDSEDKEYVRTYVS